MTLGRPTPSLTLALYLTVQCSVICWMEQLSLDYILSQTCTASQKETTRCWKLQRCWPDEAARKKSHCDLFHHLCGLCCLLHTLVQQHFKYIWIRYSWKTCFMPWTVESKILQIPKIILKQVYSLCPGSYTNTIWRAALSVSTASRHEILTKNKLVVDKKWKSIIFLSQVRVPSYGHLHLDLALSLC